MTNSKMGDNKIPIFFTKISNLSVEYFLKTDVVSKSNNNIMIGNDLSGEIIREAKKDINIPINNFTEKIFFLREYR